MWQDELKNALAKRGKPNPVAGGVKDSNENNTTTQPQPIPVIKKPLPLPVKEEPVKKKDFGSTMNQLENLMGEEKKNNHPPPPIQEKIIVNKGAPPPPLLNLGFFFRIAYSFLFFMKIQILNSNILIL